MSWLTSFFKLIGRLAVRAFGIARDNGLSDELINDALALVRKAAVELADNTARREWVITTLRAAGVPESIARLAVELAVQLWKREQGETPKP